jgi:nucleotide-binding universal stress UspA family protein
MSRIEGIKDILIALTEEGKDETTSALAYAFALARAAGAHLTVEATSIKLGLTHAMVSATAAGLVAGENRRMRELMDAAATRARAETVATGIAATIETRQLPRPQLVEAIAVQSRLHDLTVLDEESNAIDFDRSLIEAVLLKSGRPTMIIPPNWARSSFDTVLIAWDGSASATRSVNDALPFLRVATNVRIISVAGEKDLSKAIPGSDMARHLVRHGINATVETIAVRDRDVGEALRRHASEHKADLLVMGAFVHSKLRQWVLGGVTQSMLKKAGVPLLMAH